MVCILLSLFCMSSGKAFFERLTIWQMPNGQLIYGLGDVHELPSGFEEVAYMRHAAHRSFFLSALKRLKCQPEDILFIAEDALCYRGAHETVKTLINFRRSLVLDTEYSEPPIAGIIEELTEKQLPSVNIEYRITRIFGLSRQLREIIAKFYKQELQPITTKHVVQDYDEVVQELQQYPEPRLQDYYQSALRPAFEFDIRDLEPLRHGQIDILHYLDTHIPEQDRITWQDKFLEFDCPLVDARIIHHVVCNSLKKKIMVLAGAAHIYHMGKVLESLLSCRRIAHVGCNASREYGISNVSYDCLEEPSFELLQADDPATVAGCSYS